MLAYTNRRGIALAAVLAVLAVVAGGRGRAEAQGRVTKQIEKMSKRAMENFDLLEYEEARKLLNQALIQAKKNDLEQHPVVADVHLKLGIVNFSGFQDAEAAKMNFIDAVQIDPDVQISAAYKTAKMETLLEGARADFGGGGDGGGGTAPVEPVDDIDCASLQGIAHTLVDTADAGSDEDVSAHVSPELDAAKVSLHYRPQGDAEFIEVKMAQSGECRYTGTIPADAIAGEFMHYYVAAYNGGGKTIASKGSTGSPNIIEIAGGSFGSGEDENPLAGDENPLGGSGGQVEDEVETGPSEPSLFLSVALGTGGGYVTGQTEQELNDVGCCFAPALLHLVPELGYYLSKRSSISAAFRMGFPIGANLNGHATAAPAGLLRYRHALAEDGAGLQVNAAIGGGVVRHTVKLTNAPSEDMDTDTVASGPLLIGGGASWVAPLGGPIRFIAEANALAGVPVIGELGECPEGGGVAEGCVRLNFAVQFDFNMGLIFAF